MTTAWELHEDGTVTPVAEVLRRDMFGYWRVRVTPDAPITSVYSLNLLSADDLGRRYTKVV